MSRRAVQPGLPRTERGCRRGRAGRRRALQGRRCRSVVRSRADGSRRWRIREPGIAELGQVRIGDGSSASTRVGVGNRGAVVVGVRGGDVRRRPRGRRLAIDRRPKWGSMTELRTATASVSLGASALAETPVPFVDSDLERSLTPSKVTGRGAARDAVEEHAVVVEAVHVITVSSTSVVPELTQPPLSRSR